jgi:ubiquinone/menaquinone biosynthesis C-methylase UbiE
MDLLDLTGRAEAAHFWFHGFRGFVRPVIAQCAGGRPGLRLIDCGCGTGANVGLLAPHGRAFGFDLSTFGSQRAAQRNGGRVVRGDITRIPFTSGTFDIATSFDVLQCIEEDTEAIAEMTRLLRPGGTAILTLAALDILRGDHAEAWNEARRYTPRTARQLVERAGLEVERVSYLFASLFPLMLATRVSQRLLRPYRRPRRDQDIAVPAAPLNQALTWLVSGEVALARRIPMPIGSSLLVVARKR